MTAKSQTVDDIVRETKNKWDFLSIDKPLTKQQHKEFFEKATVKLDPSIYKGESGAYRADSQTYETGNQVLERMAKQSDDLQGWIAEQRYEVEKKVGPKSGYNFKRDTASGGKSLKSQYSGSFADIAKQYLIGEGRELYAHLKSKNRDFYEITKIGTQNLEGAIAALAIQGNEAALIGDKNFDKKISAFAGNYGISKQRAISYVMAHEFVHASQKGKYFDHIAAELDVEHTLKEYFTARGDKDLAAIASDRAGKVTSNYASLGTYVSPKMGKTAATYNDKNYNGNVIKGNFGAGKGSGYSGKAAA